MESSSDESFAWTNASSDSSDSNINSSKMNENQSDKESEYGSKYKKKLHKEIFGSNQDSLDKQTSSKRRITYEQSDCDYEEPVPKKKIKIEPESDRENRKMRKKHKSISRDTSEEEGYLEVKVKQERMLTANNSLDATSQRGLQKEERELEAKLNSKSKREKSELMNHSLLKKDVHRHDNITKDEEHRKKKKKSKKKRNSSETNDMSCDEEFDTTRTNGLKDNNATLTTSLEHSKDEISIIEKLIPLQNNVLTPVINIKKDKNNITLNSEMDESDDSMEIEKCTSSNNRLANGGEVVNSDSNTYSREDENISSKLKNIVRLNSHLKTITGQLRTEAIVAKDDEIWLVKCPTEVETVSFKNKKLSLEGKFKIKMDSHTYEGHAAEVDDRVAFISMKHNKFILSSKPLSGVIHLRRKIPKPHLQDNNIIESNFDNVIPLPVTKCRHPLFGADYKSAIKISKNVKAKLKSARYDTPDKNNKKKKKIKEERRQRDEDASIEPTKDNIAITETSRKKKKKKIQQDEEEVPPKRKKHKRNDLTSSEVWDSEKAIEQNLFNF